MTHETRCHALYKIGLFETICFIAIAEYGLVYFNAEIIVPSVSERQHQMISWMWNM